MYDTNGSYVSPVANLIRFGWRRVGTGHKSRGCKDQADVDGGENPAAVREQSVRERQQRAAGVSPAVGLERAW